MSKRPVKHSVTLKGHRTSISLEDEFWVALRKIAAEKNIALNALVAEIDVTRGTDIGLASAIRLYILRDLQAKLNDPQVDA
ncbi:MAG: ribbon-helix-helix domain-containing protein [Roseobacter sp.]